MTNPGVKSVVVILAILLSASNGGAQNPYFLPSTKQVKAEKLGNSVKSPSIPPGVKIHAVTIQQAGEAPKGEAAPKSDVDEREIQLTPPTPERMFRFESEEKLRQRIREEMKNLKVEFPPTVDAAPVFQPAPRIWPYLMASAEPGVVCYKRTWFQQKNSERYGWDLGVVQPLVSAGVFYTDLALLPLHWITDPCRWYECSAGECLPGDPVPFLWHPLPSK